MDLVMQLPPPPPGGFACVLIDPPWHFRTYSEKGQHRAPQRHYSTMSLADIKAIPLGDVMAKDCCVFMWTTSPTQMEAFEVVQAWREAFGLKYSSVFKVWVKLRKGEQRTLWNDQKDLFVGLGYTSRQNAEFLWLLRRGKPPRLSKSIRQVMLANRREHSRKPDETHAEIERFCAGPRLEIFGRASRPGWVVCGLEATKFDEVA